jgi:hypothetical protein
MRNNLRVLESLKWKRKTEGPQRPQFWDFWASARNVRIGVPESVRTSCLGEGQLARMEESRKNAGSLFKENVWITDNSGCYFRGLMGAGTRR